MQRNSAKRMIWIGSIAIVAVAAVLFSTFRDRHSVHYLVRELPKEAAYPHKIRFQVLHVTPVETNSKTQLVELKVRRWYGKIDMKSLERNQLHETQELTILFPASKGANINVGDIIDYQIEGYLAKSDK